jgi:hypothetical protein
MIGRTQRGRNGRGAPRSGRGEAVQRRRREAALRAGLAPCLLLAFLVAALVPAHATPPGAASPATASASAAGGDATAEGPAAGEAAEGCPAGQTGGEGGGEAETAGECDPPAAEPPTEEPPTEEPPAAEPPGDEPPAGEPPSAAPEGIEAATEDRPAAAVAPQPQATVPGQGRHGPAAVAGAPLGTRHSHRDAGAKGGRSAAAGAHGHHGRGVVRSGGTAALASPPRHWRWAGPWAIPWPIVSCESGGDYGALNPSSGAGGAYQILPSTWRAYGGAGQPQTAPPAEQDRIAARIWADSGPAAWVCAQNGNRLGAGLAGSLGPLPDPLPPARRLDTGFVSLLTRTARAHRVDWALLLAVVRLRGGRGPVPAGAAELRRLAARVAGLGGAPLRRQADELFASRAGAQRLIALARYDRAVGGRGLVEGLEAVKGRLAERVLASRRLRIYAGGRADVAAGRVDVRVLTLLLYLARSYRSVTVSCLVSGHSFLTTAGRPSLHAFGRAVDISGLNGTPILGHQEPGGIAERALRRILLLPRELQPSELISLFDLGGPSFAAADHADHIHVGF